MGSICSSSKPVEQPTTSTIEDYPDIKYPDTDSENYRSNSNGNSQSSSQNSSQNNTPK